MPRPPKSSLDSLRAHRDRKVDGAVSQVGQAVRAREAAEEAQRRAELERAEAEGRAASVRRAEAARLGSGELRVADLSRAHAWESAASAEADEGLRVLRQASMTVTGAREAELRARAALAQTQAERDAVALRQARIEGDLRRASESAELDAADEIDAARRGR
jgi:hypothetical protein